MDIGTLDQFVDAIKTEPEDRTNTYSAIVSKIDNEGTAWVYIAGSDKEAPVSGSSSEIKKGDAVVVEWRNNKLFIAGNDTNPSAGVGRVDAVEESALEAIINASIARASAESAQADADIARDAAKAATEIVDELDAKVDIVDTNVAHIQEQVNITNASVIQIEENLTTVQGQVVQINGAANSALSGLSIVEDVVGMLEWFSAHRELSADTEVDPAKTYFEYDDETGAISRVTPEGTENPSALGWYELTDAVSDFISKHLSLTSTGLWITEDSSSAKLQLNENGVALYPAGSDVPIAVYGQDAVIGDPSGFHISISATNQRISFFRNATDEVAYISGDKLYITQSVVLKKMDVGTPVVNGVGGQWSWMVRQAANGRNNLYLKWMG